MSRNHFNKCAIWLTIQFVLFIRLITGYPDSSSSVVSSTDPLHSTMQRSSKLGLWLTISAEHRLLEISWQNAPAQTGDYIILTQYEPLDFATTLKDALQQNQTLWNQFDAQSDSFTKVNTIYWKLLKNDNDSIVFIVKPSLSSYWLTTNIPFNFELLNKINVETLCYGYWINYIAANNTILASSCLHAYPRWMTDLQKQIGDLRIRDLFLPGTHDSGSYRLNFNPSLKETIITKYSLTQDENIFNQLMHGIRYLDIRVGHYSNTPEKFFINHGIIRQVSLIDVIDQIKDFLDETNEIIIFGLKEFPVGFGRNLTVHHKLVNFLMEQFGELIVHPSLTWAAKLNDIWSRKQNIILAHDIPQIVQEYPHLLFPSVEQRWGNVQTWRNLEFFLKTAHAYDVQRFTHRPVVDMAELTPLPWSVILNKSGGLRFMADKINRRVSQLYYNELNSTTNIVAVDFYRGTTITDLAIACNRLKKMPIN